MSMEDPIAEWKIQEYSPEESSGKVNCMFNKGLLLGKKIVITGLVISSAPLIIPSVVAISAVGFVCSVPCGVFLVSYTCTEKIMSMLLSRPAPGRALVGNGATFYDGEEVDGDENQGEEATCFDGINVVQKGEEEFREGVKEEIGMGIDLIGKEPKGLGEEGILENFIWHEGVRREMKNVMEDVYVTEEGYRNEDDIGTFLDDEEKTSEDIATKFKRLMEGIKLEQMKEESGGEQPEFMDSQTETAEYGKGKEVGFIQTEEDLFEEETGEFAESSARAGDIQNDCVEVAAAVNVNRKENEEGVDRFFDETEEPLEVKVDFPSGWKGKEAVVEGRSWKEPMDVDEVSTGVIVTGVDEKSSSNINESIPKEGNNMSVQRCRGIDFEEDKGLDRETRGLLERIRDEGKYDHAEEDKQRGGEVQVEEDLGVKETAGDLEEKGLKSQEHVIRTVDLRWEQKIGNSDDQTLETSKELQENESVGTMDLVPKKMKLGDLISESKEKDLNSLLKSADLVEGICEPTSDDRDTKSGDKPQIDGNIATQAPEDYNLRNAEQEFPLNGVEGIMISSSEETRETTYGDGLELWEHEKAISQPNSYINNGIKNEGSQRSPSSLGFHGGSDFSKLPVAEVLGEDQVPQKDDLGTPLDKAFYNEEKIWEQVNAIRKIIGYKGSPEETCLEEIKALYLFTGVEPPASMNDHSDLVEVNNTLHFLMSILGVK